MLAAAHCLFGGTLAAQEALREPLPLDVVATIDRHSAGVPIGFSPDGLWLAHTVATHETVPRDTVGRWYSATGFTLAMGSARPEATLTHTRTGESIRLGGPRSASWAPTWSPDGERVAFYSDEGGAAALWIWERASRTARRVEGLIVRPLFGTETPRWSSDGRRVLVKLLPEGRTIAEANAMVGGTPDEPRGGSGGPDEPSVVVRRVGPEKSEETGAPGGGAAAGAAAAGPGTSTEADDPFGYRAADLAIVEPGTGRIERLIERTQINAYAWSPDDRFIAYTRFTGTTANGGQSVYDLAVHDVEAGTARTVASDLRMGFGNEWSWAPDGRSIAYVSGGPLGGGEIVVVSIENGTSRTLGGPDVPSFSRGVGMVPPRWSPDGAFLYAVGNGELWRVAVDSGRGERVAAIPGWRITALAGPYDDPIAWSTDDHRTLWVLARESDGGRAGIFAVDLESGRTRPSLRETKSITTLSPSLAASDATGEIAYASADQQHAGDVWILDTTNGRARQGTHLNPELERYELGTVRLLEWNDADGNPLKGALLLPPGYRAGQRLPLVVWVYGDRRGSRSINTFGLWDARTFNMHVLATRGYAVLFPDAPLREGRTVADLAAAVLSGVDAAIEQGYADPERLAVMGQSFGSYNVLSLVTRTTRFRAAVISAVTTHPDLAADYLRETGHYEFGQGKMGGTLWEHRDRYLENSPLFDFDRIETPILIAHGDRDGDLVPVNATFAALERLGKPVELRLYLDEGHVITRRANVIDFWKRRLEFLAEHLGLEQDDSGRVVLR